MLKSSPGASCSLSLNMILLLLHLIKKHIRAGINITTCHDLNIKYSLPGGFIVLVVSSKAGINGNVFTAA